MEEGFLRAISAAPDDNTVRLVYADWLEERGDPRAEFVRLQVRLRRLESTDPTRSEIQAREQQLRGRCPAYWLARLDPPVWCVVGNIKDVRLSSVDENAGHGTRLFRPNAKVFLAARSHWFALLEPERYSFESIEVVGQHRKSRKWIGSWVKVGATSNWRVRLLHNPGAIVRLQEAGWLGFCLAPNEFECPADKGSIEALRALYDAIHAAVRRPG